MKGIVIKTSETTKEEIVKEAGILFDNLRRKAGIATHPSDMRALITTLVFEAYDKGYEAGKKELWLEFVNKNLCSLCGNSGIIDTTDVVSPGGIECGRKNYCICPNGRIIKSLSDTNTKQ